MPHIAVTAHKSAEIWRITRPERGNAIGPTLATTLVAACADVAARLALGEPRLRAIVLTATPVVKGPRRTWIAGGDLKELAERPSRTHGIAYAASLSRFMTSLDALPVPVLVGVDGDAIGGGAELALAGDVRIATRASRFIFKQLEVGLATGFGGARRLVELVGLSRAQDLMFGCRTISAETALAAGLIHEVVEDEAALAARLDARVEALAALAPQALAAQKAMFWHAVRSHPGAARDGELEAFGGTWGNPAHRRFLDGFGGRGDETKP